MLHVNHEFAGIDHSDDKLMIHLFQLAFMNPLNLMFVIFVDESLQILFHTISTLHNKFNDSIVIVYPEY